MAELSGAWQRTAAGAGLRGPDGTVAQTVFAEMTALAHRADAINLGQGYPDEDGPREVLEAARAAIAGGANQYAPGRGVPELRRAIADHQRRFYGLRVDPDREVLVTAGATEAIAAALLALVGSPEDEIVVFEPFYDSYAACVALTGARLVPVPLRWPAFLPDPEELERAISDRTRIILLNNPHNPTGTVFDASTLAQIIALAERHGAIIVADEVYEHLTFVQPHIPIAGLPGGRERTLTISSAGKTFSTTGWKIGWATGPAPLITAVETVKQYLTYSNGSPFQPAIALGLGLDDAFFARGASSLAHKQGVLGDALRAAGFGVSTPQGTYFTIADAAPLGITDVERWCESLAEDIGVIGIPVTAFVTEAARAAYAPLIRFAACKRLTVLEQAAARLARLSPRTAS